MKKECKPVANTPANFGPRILWGAVILLVIGAFFALRILSNYAFDLFIAGIMVLSALEIENLLHKMDKPTYSVAVGLYPMLTFASIMLVVICQLNFFHFVIFNLVVLLAMTIILFALPIIFHKFGLNSKTRDGYTGSMIGYASSKAFNTMFVCIWPTFFLSFLFALNHFGDLSVSGVASAFSVDLGWLALAMIFATSMLADTCAMLAGRFIGGPKINIEKLGPGKSWVGFAGGLLGGMIAGILVFVVFNAFAGFNSLFNALNCSIWTFLLGGLFCGLFNMGGDIFSSYFKRRAVVKDFSNLIPGHGGIMDRCNGILVNAICVFVFLIIVFG